MAVETPHFVRALVPHRLGHLLLGLGHLLLAPQGGDRHDAAGQFEKLESCGDHRALVTLLFDSHLSQDQVGRGGPRTDRMEGAAVKRAVKTIPCGLALDSHQLAGERPFYLLLYAVNQAESRSERPRASAVHTSVHTYRRRDSHGTVGERPQPRVLDAPVCRNIHSGIPSTADGTHRDYHDIQ
jgi:hypothetical protein